MTDLYGMLGVERTAPPEEIKRAYRKAAKAAHPDAPGGSQERFGALVAAYGVLSDPRKRQRYDDIGATDDLEAAINQTVLDAIAAVTVQAMQAGMDPERLNLPAEAVFFLEAQLINITRSRAAQERALAKLMKAKDRFRKGQAAKADIAQLIETGLLRTAMAQELQKKVMTGAIAVLKDYGFERAEASSSSEREKPRAPWEMLPWLT